MQGPKNPSREELSRVVGFLTEQLRPGSAWPIDKEYPQVFNASNLHNIHFIEDQGKILAHAALKTSLIQTPAGVFRVAAIGSVVTHPEFRQQGLSRDIITHCLNQADAQDCDFAILWSELHEFYRHLGFALTGQEILAVIDEELMLEKVPTKILDTLKVAPESLLRLYNKHSVISHRTEDDIRKSLQIPNTRLFTSWGPNNELLAFAVIGKGADLVGYAHEWGGNVSALLGLFAHIRRVLGEQLTVIMPAHAKNMISQLQTRGVLTVQGHLGLIKIVKMRNVCFKATRYLRGQGHADALLEPQDNGAVLTYQNQKHIFQNETDVVDFLFSPGAIEKLKMDKAFLALETSLPLPMWIWGWDSI